MGRRHKGQLVHGWLNLDKPFGLSSSQAVSRVQRAFDAKKVGHGGTLDPLATGILPIAFGEATKTVKVPMTTAFGDIAKAVKSAFSDELDGSAIALKYKDPEGDLITATCRADVRYAMASHVAAKPVLDQPWAVKAVGSELMA